MPSPSYILIQKRRRKLVPVLWNVEFDNNAMRVGETQTIPDALIAVQLAIDEMRDEK